MQPQMHCKKDESSTIIKLNGNKWPWSGFLTLLQFLRTTIYMDTKKLRVWVSVEKFIAGELIQQQNPDKIFTGEGPDQVGPGHYELRRGLVDRKKGTNWHASNVKRVVGLNKTTDAANVGPGAYEPVKQVTSVPQYKIRGSSSFISRVPKGRVVGISQDSKRRPEDDADSETDEGDVDVFSHLTPLGHYSRTWIL